MSAAIFRLPASTKLNAQQALESALQEGLSDVMVIGYTEDGDLFIRSSRMTCAEGAFLAQKALHWALSGGEDQ